MKEGLNKETLRRLYIKEKKSTAKIAKMFDCTPMTVWMRCKKYGIKLRTRDHKNIEGLSKSLLQKLYVKEGKSTYEIGIILGCSYETVRVRCKNYGILLRPNKKSVDIDRPTLHRLYIEEGKTVIEVASIFNCSSATISKRARKFGIELRKPWKKSVDIDESTLRRLHIQEGKTFTEIAKIFNCAVTTISDKAEKYGVKNMYMRKK